MIPDEGDRVKINEVVFGELVYGIVRRGSRDYLVNVIRGLNGKGVTPSCWAVRSCR